ncbi:glycosyl hydrolase family 3 N terminal domain-containing protein [Dactylonectria macrodidyma]|uniref:beta-glucosidase n=1 Tax=Dactylonectria macrodidyma TaxID=307937 RepID=A0A9P9JRL0_9HYPO|nr:glycosyl hydrolase family 3 N terminal domain-containing protein [Dactylonectria macrodidyma]
MERSRPAIRKRPRPEVADDQGPRDAETRTSPAAAAAALPRSRGATACEKCRARKSKCDNQRPSCGYCSKRQIPCVYADDATAARWSVSGTEMILDAITNLSSLVEQQQQHQCCPCHSLTDDNLRHKGHASRDYGVTNEQDRLATGQSISPTRFVVRSQGFDSIREWGILECVRKGPRLILDSPAPSVINTNHSLPNTNYSELQRLERKYINGIHLKNPILDLPELHQMILHVAENGVDWTTQSCLVTLVCALGAITQEYHEQHMSPNNQLTPGAPLPSYASDGGQEPNLSMQFWSLASKRLGSAIGQNDPQAVQCLCLAGIWYMHQMQPLQAWKYFDLAGSAWHAVNLSNDQSGDPFDDSQNLLTSFTVMQALYFTIWKSEWELRVELPLPSPILDIVGFPHAFPLPPNVGQSAEISDNERTWYYYLAEIAARHLFNRLVTLHSWPVDKPTSDQVQRMIAQADIFEAQLHDWYISLPPIFQFDIPDGYTSQPHPDDLTQILRSRYLCLRELVARPFVKLTVDTPLDIDPRLRARVISLASLSLQYCMLKLSQVAPHRHQGTWFGLRNVASSSLILGAVNIAHQRTWLTGAQELALPQGWRERVAQAVETIGPYWDEPSGGAPEMKRIVQSVLHYTNDHILGKDFWHTTPLPRFNVPSVRLSDGPNGVRGTKFFDGVPAACLPCGTGLAATWDQELLHKAGVLIGEECKAKGAHCWLGPTVCIQRSPLGGRGFESMSEDPYATGKLAAAYIKGVQSTGVISAIKHWLANDQEHERIAVNAIVDERALREIHMLPFHIAIRDANPGAVMSCYNRVNGVHVSESDKFLNGILRDEWGWRGLVMSDWFGTYSTAESLNAGLDLEMPGPTRLRGPLADLAVSNRKVSRATIDSRARNVLEFVQKGSQIDVATEGTRDWPEDRVLNRKLASDSIVLLKNEADVLPLKKSFKSVALIGPNMKTTAFCGGGSASLQPYYTVSPYEGIVNQLTKDVEIHYELGAYSHSFIPTLRAPELVTPEGNAPGLRMRFFREQPSVSDRVVIEEKIIPESSWLLMGFSHPKLEPLFYAEVEADLVATTTGSFKVGLAVYGSGNLYIDGVLIIDNTTVQRGGNFWFGKGTLEESAVIDLIKGQRYRIKVEFASAPSSKLRKPGVVNFGGGAARFGIIEVLDPDLAIARAVEAAKRADITILCAGLTRDQESEGFDRPNMDPPESITKLISAVLDADPNAIMVSQSGSPFSMPWADRSTTHLHAWFGGNETGNGIADVIFGRVNPSGKLPLSFPRRLEDTPTFLNFGSERGRVVYGESIYIGYRYYEKVLRDILYPFGHGLSYITFTYSDLKITPSSATLQITNSGSVPGAEAIQLYVAAPMSSIPRPRKELKGFAKVFLQPAESQTIEVQFDRFTTAFWDEELSSWVCEKGTYTILVGSSSQDIRLEGELVQVETVTWPGI